MDRSFEILKILADETRFNIIQILLKHDFCVGALAKQLEISQAAVSQHMQILRKAGIVKGEKRGYWTHYMVDKAVLLEISQYLQNLAHEAQAERICSKSDTDQECCCLDESKK